MKTNQKIFKNAKYLVLLVVLMATILITNNVLTSRAESLSDGTRVEEDSSLLYYLDVFFDGKDVNNTNSLSDYIYVEDKIPSGLIFEGFVGTHDGTIGAVDADDNTPCLGYVVDGVAGLSYDPSTRKVTFKVNELQTGCKLTVGIKTKTPFLGTHNRLDFYNTASMQESSFTNNSNTVHVYMAKDDTPLNLNKVIYKYIGEVPKNAPLAPIDTKYAEGAIVGVSNEPSVAGYDFNGWNTTDVTVTNGQFDMPNGEVIFEGSFTKKQTYTVSYEIEGHIPDGYIKPDSKDYYENQNVKVNDLKADDEIGDYVFTGWSTTDVTISNNEFSMPTKNVVLKGKFEKKKFNVSYEFVGDVLPSNANSLIPPTTEHEVGEEVFVADKLEVTGYDFIGWYQEEVFNMPSQDITVYGEWALFSGKFAPEIKMEIIDEKDNYKTNDIVKFKITVTNKEIFAIKNVILSENQNSYFTSGSGYTLLTENMVQIPSIAANSSITVYAEYFVNDRGILTKENTVELVSALSDSSYFLDDSQSYKAQSTFKIINISLEINSVNEKNEVLSDAEFKLFKDADLTEEYSFDNSSLSYEDLEINQTYYLKEIFAPNGYNQILDTIEVKVDNNGKVSANGFAVENNNGLAKIKIVYKQIKSPSPQTYDSIIIYSLMFGTSLILLVALGFILIKVVQKRKKV